MLAVVRALDSPDDSCGFVSDIAGYLEDDTEEAYGAEEAGAAKLKELASAVRHGGVVILSVVLPLNGSYVSSTRLACCDDELLKFIVTDIGVEEGEEDVVELGTRSTRLVFEYMIELDARGAGP
jgi:hypothetical protein